MSKKNNEKEELEEKESVNVVDESSENTDTEGKSEEENTTDSTDTKIKELDSQINELNDKYLRLYSEYENFRKRTAKEKLELIGTASEDIMKALLPIMDDFQRAIKSNEEATDIDAVKEGITLIFNKFQNTLTQKGLKPMELEAGADFDLDLHEAITKIPAPDKSLQGKVVDVVEKGYYLNDKVIRYSKVVIGE